MADADTLLSSTTHSDVRVVRITTEPCHAEPDNTLSINPLNWRAFAQACGRALPASDLVQTTSAATHALLATVPPCDTQGAHILVTESRPINRELIVRQLRLLGYRITLAEDGVVTLERPYKHRFDAPLTDCHMPRMDSLDLARHIRREEGDDLHLSIIAVMATTLAEEYARCRAASMDTSLLKSTTPATLQEALSTLCTDDVHAGAGGATEGSPILSLNDLHAVLGTDPAVIGLVQVFLSSLTDDAQRLQPLLDAMDCEVLRRWARRTGGVLTLLHNPGVDAAVEAFRHAVHSGSANTIRAAGARTTRLLTHINGLFSVFGSPAADIVHHTQVTDS